MNFFLEAQKGGVLGGGQKVYVERVYVLFPYPSLGGGAWWCALKTFRGATGPSPPDLTLWPRPPLSGPILDPFRT